MPNLNFIKEHGIEKFMEQQKKRIKLLEIMIENFDDGRSRSFFCKVAALFDLTSSRRSLDKAIRKIKTEKIKQNDVKNKAKILKTILNEVALEDRLESIKMR